MKTITRLLATAALLLGVVGGVSSVKAEQVYANPSSWLATWTAPSTFSWSSSDINGFHMVYTGFPTNNANWTQYELLHVNVASLTGAKSDEKGAYIYVKIVDNNNAEQKIKFYNGENTIYLSDYANLIDLTNIKECLLWADMAEGVNEGSATVTEFYLQTPETVDQNVEITVGGEARNYQLYVPDKDLTNCPLVISLHGAGGHSTDYSPFRKVVADEANCIVAYPQGKETSFPIGFGGSKTGWTASGEDNFDVEFLKAVIEDVASKYQIDRKRIYCCGFSNGGMMTYAMANACSDEIAAFASISGYPINEFHLHHTGDRPVPFMYIHGKEDGFVPYAKVPTIVDEMVARLGANPVPTTTAGSGYTKSVYAAADGSFPYVYYEIDGMGHSDYTANTEDGSSAKTMWNFFNQYTLDSPSDATLKWAPRIDENGYNPAEHGWTVNSGTTLLQFGGEQYTTDNKNVYHSLQFNGGSYKLSFKSTGAEGKTVGVKIEKLTSPNTVVLNTTVNVGETVELPFTVSDGWGEYKLTMTRPSADDAITISDLAVTQNYSLHASGFSTSGTNITYADGKLKWTDTSNNVARAITAEAGVIAKFSSIHFTCSGLTEGATYRVMLTTSDKTNYISEINATGDVTVNFSDLTKQFGSEKLTPEILETVTQVRIGGGTGGSPSPESPYEMTIDLSSFCLESEEDQLSIANTSDWVLFSKMVNAGVSPLDVILTADVDAGSTMVGTDTDGKRYTGTFDGAGHTLTFTYNGGETEVGPFKCVQGATFKDLQVTGSITSSGQLIAGLIGRNKGATSITRCKSSVDLTTNHSDSRPGGFVGRSSEDGAIITFSYSMYDGSITATKQGCGFVGWASAQTMNVSHCLVASSNVTGGGSNFIGGYGTKNISDSYYLNKFGSSAEGTQLTDQLRYSGQAAYTLNQGIGSGALFFGQGKLNSSVVEATPTLTSVASKKVIRTYKGETDFYSNPGGLLPDPALASMLSWKFAMSGEAPYQTHLPAEQTTDREIYGTPDAYILVIGSAEASTFVFPFTTDGLPDGVKAYDLTFDGSVINATEVTKITADKPVLINVEAGTYKFESKLNYWESVNFSDHTETTNGALTGVYNTSLPFSYVPKDAYVLQNGADGLGFYKVAADNTIKITSFRAYLTAQSNNARLSIKFVDNDEPTGIESLTPALFEGEGAVYDLQGRRVEKATKGLYIKNGKKVIIK